MQVSTSVFNCESFLGLSCKMHGGSLQPPIPIPNFCCRVWCLGCCHLSWACLVVSLSWNGGRSRNCSVGSVCWHRHFVRGASLSASQFKCAENVVAWKEGLLTVPEGWWCCSCRYRRKPYRVFSSGLEAALMWSSLLLCVAIIAFGPIVGVVGAGLIFGKTCPF